MFGRSQLVFEAPVVSVDAPGVILTTYFNSRVDPLRCYKHKVWGKGWVGGGREGGRDVCVGGRVEVPEA